MFALLFLPPFRHFEDIKEKFSIKNFQRKEGRNKDDYNNNSSLYGDCFHLIDTNNIQYLLLPRYE